MVYYIEIEKFLSKNLEMKNMKEASYKIGIEIFYDGWEELLKLSHKS